MSFSHDARKKTRLRTSRRVGIFYTMQKDNVLARVLANILGADRAEQALAGCVTTYSGVDTGNDVPRGLIAEALQLALLVDLVERVPQARARIRDVVRSGAQISLDHGALRTVRDAQNGALPAGTGAFERILEPLGYRRSRTYPLPKLAMTGYSFTHLDRPEAIAQYFVSEISLESFSPAFQAAARRVVATSRDPLTARARALLAQLSLQKHLSIVNATELIAQLLPCFARQHELPTVEDYEILLRESSEMAWIATEGNTFNHVTERVLDIERVADEQRALRRPIKEAIETSTSRTIRQTAYKADPVQRTLRLSRDGATIVREVPGSFYEFIQRERILDDNGHRRLDLSFDSGNAQGIFKMTAAA
jgi:hypothetical protein